MRLLLVIILLLVAPLSLFAYSWYGSWTLSNPFVVSDCSHLASINLYLTGHFVLSGDLDCRSWWNDIVVWGTWAAVSGVFTWSFDGGWYTIWVAIDLVSRDRVGLFRQVDWASISHVSLTWSVVWRDRVWWLIWQSLSSNISSIFFDVVVSWRSRVWWLIGSSFHTHVVSNSWSVRIQWNSPIWWAIGRVDNDMIVDLSVISVVTWTISVWWLVGYSDGWMYEDIVWVSSVYGSNYAIGWLIGGWDNGLTIHGASFSGTVSATFWYAGWIIGYMVNVGPVVLSDVSISADIIWSEVVWWGVWFLSHWGSLLASNIDISGSVQSAGSWAWWFGGYTNIGSSDLDGISIVSSVVSSGSNVWGLFWAGGANASFLVSDSHFSGSIAADGDFVWWLFGAAATASIVWSSVFADIVWRDAVWWFLGSVMSGSLASSYVWGSIVWDSNVWIVWDGAFTGFDNYWYFTNTDIVSSWGIATTDILGCTDSTATNYSPLAFFSTPTCIYPSPRSGGGWVFLIKDYCPDGDLSPSYYDGTCEKIVNQKEDDIANTFVSNLIYQWRFLSLDQIHLRIDLLVHLYDLIVWSDRISDTMQQLFKDIVDGLVAYYL